MRFILKEKIKKEFKYGDTRIINKFSLFPKKINNQIRWLVKVRIKQEYTYFTYGAPERTCEHWKDLEFLD